MSEHDNDVKSRRKFLDRVGQLAVGVAMAGVTTPSVGLAMSPASAPASRAGEWDLSWVPRVEKATDKLVIDTTSISDGNCLQLATRYLDNCDAVYGAGKHKAQVVLNLRSRATTMSLVDALWDKYEIGKDANVSDPDLRQLSRRNLWLTVPRGQPAAIGSISDLSKRGAIILVCDFSLGHLATRLSGLSGEPADAVHAALRAGMVPGAIAMPSGIFGLTRAQNAGCAMLTA